MDKRKEMEKNFNPEDVDFVRVVEMLDWSSEVSPVMLVKAVNKVQGLKGTKKYETNEKSFGSLLKVFEKKVGEMTTTRFHGKDRFYSLKAKYEKDQLVHYVKTGEVMEMPKKKERYFVPTPQEMDELRKQEEERKLEREQEEAKKKKKSAFPDDEALLKTALLLSLLKENKGSVGTSKFTVIREREGWTRQRALSGRQWTIYQEVSEVCKSLLDYKENPIKATAKVIKYTDSLDILEGKIKDVVSLIDDEKIKAKVTVEEKKPEPKPDPVIEKKVEEPKPTVKVEPKREETRVFKTSPEVGKSEVKEVTTPGTTYYESSKNRWTKALIGEVLKGAGRGTYFGFNDISQIIKKTRYQEIQVRDIKDMVNEINRQYRGIFREQEFGGIVIGSEVLVKMFAESYQAEKITETIFVRLKQSLTDLKEDYPDLQIEIASEIGENDNIYKIEMNRGERTERAFAKLVYCMRRGEVILESPSNWTIKRVKILIDKFGLNQVY